MSSSALPTPSTADAHEAGCSHCDGSVPHEHIDVRAELTAAARKSRTRSSILLTVAVVPLVTGLVLAAVAGNVLEGLFLVLAVVTGWVLATAVGVVVAQIVGRRSVRFGLASGTAATSALGPVVGLAAGIGLSLASDAPLAAALVAGGTWWTMSALVDAFASAAWRRSLFAPGDVAEQARSQAIAGRKDTQVVSLAWLVQGPAVALATVLSGLPALAVVLLAALCAALSIRGSAHRK